MCDRIQHSPGMISIKTCGQCGDQSDPAELKLRQRLVDVLGVQLGHDLWIDLSKDAVRQQHTRDAVLQLLRFASAMMPRKGLLYICDCEALRRGSPRECLLVRVDNVTNGVVHFHPENKLMANQLPVHEFAHAYVRIEERT